MHELIFSLLHYFIFVDKIIFVLNFVLFNLFQNDIRYDRKKPDEIEIMCRIGCRMHDIWYNSFVNFHDINIVVCLLFFPCLQTKYNARITPEVLPRSRLSRVHKAFTFRLRSVRVLHSLIVHRSVRVPLPFARRARTVHSPFKWVIRTFQGLYQYHR